MTDIRQTKVDNIANDMPLTWVEGDLDADVLMIGWGSTWGSIASAVKQAEVKVIKSLTHTSFISTHSQETLGNSVTLQDGNLSRNEHGSII